MSVLKQEVAALEVHELMCIVYTSVSVSILLRNEFLM